LTAKTKINRKDFGLVWGLGVEATQMVVSELVTKEIDVEAMPQPTDVQEPAIAQ
jgi:polyisoprenoid-binding protein YceI